MVNEMTTSPEKFAKLLTRAIYRIRLEKNKNLSYIQDKLGHAIGREEKGRHAIDDWRKGKRVPAKTKELELLARELVKQDGLKQREELKNFLYWGGHPNPAILCDELFPSGDKQPDDGQVVISEIDEPIGPLSLDSKGYVEREADREFEALLLRERMIISLRGSGQVGKSSLLMRGLHKATQAGITVIKLDLQLINEADLDSFLRYLAELIAEQIGIDKTEVTLAWEQESLSNPRLTNFMENCVLAENGPPIVLAFDNTDSLFETDFHAKFFSLIRSWHSTGASEKKWRRLNVVLVISTEPHLFNPEYASPLFNVAHEIHLKDFREDQVATLIRRYEACIENQDLTMMMALLNGHPYLTHRAIYKMDNEGLSWIALAQEATNDEGPFGNHLRHQYQRLLNSPNLLKALEQIIQSGSCLDKNARHHLSRAGLVKKCGEKYTFRCDLYKSYFEDKLKKMRGQYLLNKVTDTFTEILRSIKRLF
jgi:hypothetical protein